MATREEILVCSDMVYEMVTVPEWQSARICVRSLVGDEKDAFESASTKVKGKGRKERRFIDPKGLRVRLIIAACCVAEGDPTPYFKPEDAPALGKKNGAALDRLFEVAQKLAGFSDEDIDELGND